MGTELVALPIVHDTPIEQTIAEQVDAVIIEKGVDIHLATIASKWLIGQALSVHPRIDSYGVMAEIMRYMSCRLSTDTLYRCRRFYKSYPDLDRLVADGKIEDAILERFGKGITWTKLREAFSENAGDETEETAYTPAERRRQGIGRIEVYSESRIDRPWTVEQHNELKLLLNEIK